jgi:hypothetical protein
VEPADPAPDVTAPRTLDAVHPTGIVRYRRLVVGTAVVCAAACVGLQLLAAPRSSGRLVLVLLPGAVAVACLVLSITALRDARPAAFVVDPRTPAFRPVPRRTDVYAAVSVIFLAGGQVAGWTIVAGSAPVAGPRVARIVTGVEFTVGTVLVASMVAVTGVLAAALWRGVGVQLRPEGLVDRGPVGRLTVPWEALTPGYPFVSSPSARSLVLSYARPELIRQRGLVLSRQQINAGATDPRFLGRALVHYVAHPQYRAAIGTQVEHDRLLAALNQVPAPA